MKYTAIVDGEKVDVTLVQDGPGRFEAEAGGRKYQLDVVAVQTGVYWVNWNNHSFEVAITPTGSGYLVSVNGQHVSVELLDTRSALRKVSHSREAGAVELRAPMPGKVVRVLVAEGEAVNANQGLVVMEAMKMQNEMKSPKAGVVRKIAVKNGSVNAGDLLAVVE